MLRKLSILSALVSISALFFNVSSVSAHNTFSESFPSEGQQLTTAPTEWSIVFEKPVPLNSASGAYYIYKRYGKTFEEEENVELNRLLRSTNKTISREAKYYYNKNYRLK